MAKRINFEDRLLGMMAVEKRFISEKQLTECLNTLEFFEPERTLESIFLGKEYLTKLQVERLRQQLQASIELESRKNDKSKTQKIFGEVALEQNMVDQSQLEMAIQEQQKYDERGLRVQIGQIMLKMGFMTMAQVGRLLDSQLKKILYCKSCKVTKTILNYNPARIYQCETCKLDLIESHAKKQEVAPKKVEQTEEDEGDVGNLDILEL